MDFYGAILTSPLICTLNDWKTSQFLIGGDGEDVGHPYDEGVMMQIDKINWQTNVGAD